jgi:ferredoxin
MILYFSGTGNSKFVAEQMAKELGLSTLSIPELVQKLDRGESIKLTSETLGFVFPIYAWGPPKMVLDLITRLDYSHVTPEYTFAVATCGEDTGKAMDILRKALGFKGIELHAIYSVKMPNNYCTGSVLDTEERVRELIRNAKEKLPFMVADIKAHINPVVQVNEGPLAWVKTYWINPLFNQQAIRPQNFRALDSCTACGACEKICMTNNIHLTEQLGVMKPKWGKNCTFCLACINSCPVEAIQHGKKSANSGRYTFHDSAALTD